jgi:hypothetical protein
MNEDGTSSTPLNGDWERPSRVHHRLRVKEQPAHPYRTRARMMVGEAGIEPATPRV